MTARSIFAMVVPSWAIVGSNVAHSADWVKVMTSPPLCWCETRAVASYLH
jgi:hypothetical protein